MIEIPSDKILFGQFLLENKKIDQSTLDKALKIQQKEKTSQMKDSHRLLGSILYEDFKVFESRVDLNHWTTNFQKYKTAFETNLVKTIKKK